LQGQRKKRRLETAEMADCDAVKAENNQKAKGSPYSITERRVSQLIPVLGSEQGLNKPVGREVRWVRK